MPQNIPKPSILPGPNRYRALGSSTTIRSNAR